MNRYFKVMFVVLLALGLVACATQKTVEVNGKVWVEKKREIIPGTPKTKEGVYTEDTTKRKDNPPADPTLYKNPEQFESDAKLDKEQKDLVLKVLPQDIEIVSVPDPQCKKGADSIVPRGKTVPVKPEDFSELFKDKKIADRWLSFHNYGSQENLIEASKKWLVIKLPSPLKVRIGGMTKYEDKTLEKDDPVFVEKDGNKYRVVGRLCCLNPVISLEPEKEREIYIVVVGGKELEKYFYKKDETTTTNQEVVYLAEPRPRYRLEGLIMGTSLDSKNSGDYVNAQMSVSVRNLESNPYLDVTVRSKYWGGDWICKIDVPGIGSHLGQSVQFPIPGFGEYVVNATIDGTNSVGDPIHLTLRQKINVTGVDQVKDYFTDDDAGDKSPDGNLGLALEGRIYWELGKLSPEKKTFYELYTGLGGVFGEGDPELFYNVGFNIRGPRLSFNIGGVFNNEHEGGAEAGLSWSITENQKWILTAQVHHYFTGDYNATRYFAGVGYRF